MSWQMAMMGGQAALSAVSAISSAARGTAAVNRGIERTHEAEQQAATETNFNIMGTKVREAQYLTAAQQTDITSAEVGIRTAQQEKARRVELERLGQANAIDLVGRGGISTGQDSLAAIDNYNRGVAEEDVSNIRMMGDSAKRQLSFRRKNLEFGALGESLRGVFAQLSGAFKQRNLEDQIEEAGAKARDIGTDALFKVLGSAVSMGASMSSGGSSSGQIDMAAEAKRSNAFGLGG